MALPTYEDMMRPVLSLMSDGQTRRLADIKHAVANGLNLSPQDREAVDARGRSVAESRVYWALFYLFRAGMFERPSRSMYITDRGREALGSTEAINNRYLARYEEFRSWLAIARTARVEPATAEVQVDAATASPDDLIEQGVQALRSVAIDDIKKLVQELTPTQFERLVTHVIESLGYVGAHGHGETTRPTADGGIDGVIHQDRLGLQRILLQAKRWTADNRVPRPEIDKFLGVLGREGVNLGVFITTSSFTVEAREGVRHLGGRVALIDGDELADLMYEHGVGVAPESTVVIKRVDRRLLRLAVSPASQPPAQGRPSSWSTGA